MLLAALLALAGCVKKPYPPDRPVVASVGLRNAGSVDSDDVLEGLATAKSPRFLGIWDGVVFDYVVYDKTLLAKDLQRVERYYQRRGWYEAKVTAARVWYPDPDDRHHVKVQISVVPGPRVVIGSVGIHGLERLPIKIATQAYAAGTDLLNVKSPFEEDAFNAAKKAVGDTLADNGYAFVKVDAHAKIDLEKLQADIEIDVKPGPAATYGKVSIVGLREIPEGPVRANLNIEPGEPYSHADLREAQDALINLGVFASVDVRQDTSKPETQKVPITVVVRESSLRTLQLGGGIQADVLRLSGHLRIGWEDRNFLGGMRDFSIDTRPGVTLFPASLYQLDSLGKGIKPVPENYLRAELRQPSFIEGRTTGFVASEFNVYPLLYPNMSVNDRIIGYLEIKASAGVERAFFGYRLYVTPSYNWQSDRPFIYPNSVTKDKPDGLDPVQVSFPELVTHLDFRNDRIQPTEGFYLTNSLQVAGYIFGGTVSDVRVRPEARIYLPMTRSHSVVLAVRAAVGLLFPHNYGSSLNDPSLDPYDPAVVRDQHKLLFRAFYSGGPNSNRGYAYREVGPQGPLGFLVPTGVNCSLTRTGPGGATTTLSYDQLPAQCNRPLGGLTLWEASLEVRFPIAGPVRGATFLDSSDVTRRVADIAFNAPHLSAGLGLRYTTPVGPLRFDVGWRLPGLQVISGTRNEGTPGTTFGLPIAFNIALGEAF